MDQPVILQVGVKILLRNAAGQYLLLRRSVKKYPEAQGRWDIVGGRINPGAPLLDNLRREVKEETGLDIIGEPRLAAAQDILRIPGRHVIRLTYVGRAQGELKLDEEENDAYKWYSQEEILVRDDMDAYLEQILPDII